MLSALFTTKNVRVRCYQLSKGLLVALPFCSAFKLSASQVLFGEGC